MLRLFFIKIRKSLIYIFVPYLFIVAFLVLMSSISPNLVEKSNEPHEEILRRSREDQPGESTSPLSIEPTAPLISAPQVNPENLENIRLAAEQGNPEAQVNLGLAYAAGRGVSVDYVEAVRLFRLAAEQGNAEARVNLGAALRVLGEQEGGTARLEEAVAISQAVVKEVTRDRAPLKWAYARANLADALRVLGERESGTARLEQAVAAYRAALEVVPHDGASLEWAYVRANLADALRMLGERESGTARLEQAVAAYSASLAVTVPRWPLNWARSVLRRQNATQVEIARRRQPQ